ncbi:capsule biosynthesis GfcC family protein [Vibrio sp. Sgm 22]|uniref:capsule biosynthesis GfcC family protein n=1 Tax=unclassified Vibrio TaxID=2614977 RepID=UPI00224990EF|nr:MULTISPECIES: capsule biosynthesis GfcC family protein [unclassified Vibrio]MCX2758257.1 capsule biosynthesis GfcC family protein [Vibrio sp. 14G-20]MCX2775383.1 capsule biosynthesis GfcC family protein [Vibrio sp. Sgm 22]
MNYLKKLGYKAALTVCSVLVPPLVMAQSQVPVLTVELPVQGITLQYSQPARLDQVLTDANANGALGYFPLSAQLFDRNAQPQVDKVKQQVFETLEHLALQEPQAKSVIKQLESFDYQTRYFVDLDNNAVMSQADKNPLLVSRKPASQEANAKSTEQQHFELYLTARPTSVNVVGAVKQAHTLSLVEHAQLDNYLTRLPKGQLLDIADNSTAFVIQPDGQVNEISYAYWNSKPTYFAPGAVIFLAFDSLPSEFSTLNQDIVELLRHKVNL